MNLSVLCKSVYNSLINQYIVNKMLLNHIVDKILSVVTYLDIKNYMDYSYCVILMFCWIQIQAFLIVYTQNSD